MIKVKMRNGFVYIECGSRSIRRKNGLDCDNSVYDNTAYAKIVKK